MSGPCPSCEGCGYKPEVIGDYAVTQVTCPDCAGTGKAEDSITVNENDAEAWRRHWMEAVALEHKAVKRGNRLAAALKRMVAVFPRPEPGDESTLEASIYAEALAAVGEWEA